MERQRNTTLGTKILPVMFYVKLISFIFFKFKTYQAFYIPKNISLFHTLVIHTLSILASFGVVASFLLPSGIPAGMIQLRNPNMADNHMIISWKFRATEKRSFIRIWPHAPCWQLFEALKLVTTTQVVSLDSDFVVILDLIFSFV